MCRNSVGSTVLAASHRASRHLTGVHPRGAWSIAVGRRTVGGRSCRRTRGLTCGGAVLLGSDPEIGTTSGKCSGPERGLAVGVRAPESDDALAQGLLKPFCQSEVGGRSRKAPGTDR